MNGTLTQQSAAAAAVGSVVTVMPSAQRSRGGRALANNGFSSGRGSNSGGQQQQQQRRCGSSSMHTAVNNAGSGTGGCGSMTTSPAARSCGQSVNNCRNVTSSPSLVCRRRKPQDVPTAMSPPYHRAFFVHALQHYPPSVPPAVLRGLDRQEATAVGRVKVMLRVVAPDAGITTRTPSDASFLEVDARRKQLTIYEPPNPSLMVPSEEQRCLGVAAPKMFAFDNIFVPEDSQAEICSRALADVLPAVVNGSDACLFTYGYSKLGKTHTMIGDGDPRAELGIIPCAIWWLFKLIGEQKQRTGARFSVRVSATEVAGKGEELRDLLAQYASGTEGCGFSPGHYFQEFATFGSLLRNQCELRVPSAVKAAHYLDEAVAGRSTNFKEFDGISHFIFTFHVYQYRMDKSGSGGMSGGRSRLHLIDLCGCEKQSLVYSASRSYRLSMANLGNVVLAIFNGQKHVPFKNSKLTQILQEILGNVTCQASMIAHVSPLAICYTESLATIQLASRIHRLRHKKWKHHFNAGGGEGVSDDPASHIQRRSDGPRSSSSDFDYTSSDTCDTVIFVGSREKSMSAAPNVNVANTSRPGFAQVRQMTGFGACDSTENFKQTSGAMPVIGYDTFRSNPANDAAQASAKAIFGHAASRIPVPAGATAPSLSRTGRPVATPVEVNNHRPIITNSFRPRDEFWVDGPHASRSKVQRVGRVRAGGPAGPEMWIDGPQVHAAQDDAPFLDNHKRAMIERWIEMQGDEPRDDGGGDGGSGIDALFARVVDRVASHRVEPGEVAAMLSSEVDIVSTVDSIVSGEETERSGSVVATAAAATASNEDIPKSSQSAAGDDDDDDFAAANAPLDDCSASKSQDGYEDDVLCQVLLMERLESGDVGLILRHRHVQPPSSEGVILEVDEEEEEEDEEERGDRAQQPGQILTADSWVQVSEEDILEEEGTVAAVCRGRPFDDHPLRVLSSESLAVSFTNASSRSWDSGLNAVRQAMAYATDNLPDDDEEDVPFDFGPFAVKPGSNHRVCLEEDAAFSDDARSVCSEPGACASYFSTAAAVLFSSSSLWKPGSCGSGSWRGLAALGSSRTCCSAVCSSFGSNDMHLKSTGIIRCFRELCCSDDGDPRLLRCPDGASDPHLDRRPFCCCRGTAGDRCPCLGSRSWDFTDAAVGARAFPTPAAVRRSPSPEQQPKAADGGRASAVKIRSVGSGRSSAASRRSMSGGDACRATVESSSGVGGHNDGCEREDSHGGAGASALTDQCGRAAAADDGDFDRLQPPTEDGMPTCDLMYSSMWAAVHSGSSPCEDGTVVHRDNDSGTGSSSCSTKEKSLPSAATSSGYDSMPRDSASIHDSVSLRSEERSASMSRRTSKENDGSNNCSSLCVEVSVSGSLLLLKDDGSDSFELTVYDEEDVERMERRRAFEKGLELRRYCSRVRFLRRRQEELQKEFEVAKRLLMMDDARWSCDLHVEENMDVSDPGYLEALETETAILEKRVVACKSHLMLVTCFDVTEPDPREGAETKVDGSLVSH